MTAPAGTEPILVQVMLHSAQKLLSTLRSEPEDAEERGRATDVLRLAFGPIWSRVPLLELSMAEGSIEWRGHAVLAAEEDHEGLLETLASAGIRSLTLAPGVEDAEIQQFLLAVHEVRSHVGPELDLATLLFRADLDHLAYAMVESVDAGARQGPPPRVARGAPAKPTPADVREAVRRDAGGVGPTRGVVRLERYESTLYFLDQREIEYLRAAIEREYSQDLATNVLSLLIDTLQLRREPEVRGEVLDILADLMPHLLSEGRFDAVAHLIAEARRVAQDAADLSPDHKKALDELRASVSEPRAISQLFHALDDGAVRPTAESMGILLRELRPDAIRQILEWSGMLSDLEAKQAVLEALEAFFTEWPHTLGRMLSAPRREVVHSALALAVRLRLPGFVDPVAEIARHEDTAIRVLVARALASIGTISALRHLLSMAEDDDGDVRLEVWRTFVARPHRGALRTLQSAVGRADIEVMGRREKRVLFEAFGAVAGSEGVVTLESLLRGKSPSGVRLGAHTRACAAVGLGAVGTPQARTALERAARDRDPVVRSAVSAALRGDA